MHDLALSILWIFTLLLPEVIGFQKEMTIIISPGGKDCFHENGQAGQTVDIDYQVIDGSHGDLDINFDLSDSTGRIIFADYKKSDNIHRHKLPQDTELTFCFNNEFSRINSKTVFFELIIEKEDEDAGWSNFDILEGLSPEEFYDMKVQDIEDIIKRVRNNLTKARQFQDILRSHEARDRNIAEENYFKVNAWSFFQIFIMISVGFLQVVMVKSLFDTQSKAHRIWSKM
ncbi:transmembrane emp24 domain-containing protein 1 [Toxorhynchites rutilus septentrionalis]|uniref:transmembrane emp24 domain-containing protein 1 n=1 Tax=Toxorhynchites rutilus septentrionalis TaxID=329112 RepID=UPI0024786AC8|nr:transmembrane emp24 domain-containing protein 1 [Toxorhynchites rutilus septentrionalis]